MMRVLLMGLILSMPVIGSAEPIVRAGQKPGAATSWSLKQNAIVLEIGEEYDPMEIAEAISRNVKGATAKAKGSSVIVTGVTQDVLLAGLAEIEVEPAGDDIDEMLGALQNPGGDDEGSGSSIRATQATDFSDVLGTKSELITAKVVSVKRHRFPVVMVTVKILGVPKGLKGVRKGQKLTVLPRVKSKNGVIDPHDKASKLNVGAWYAVAGDKVRVRLEKPANGEKVWIAAAFERLE